MNNDLISREALKKSMRKSINERYICWSKTITVADIATLIFDEIDNAPTVAERLQGKWQVKDGLREGFYICSNCGEISCCKGSFCPDCGADMQKGGAE